MSKLIVEMEMPRYMCSDCEISIDGFACKKSRTNGGKCPIVGVLPDEHGDLIDRDVAFDYINRLICDGCNAETEADCEACIKKGIDEVLYFVKPTIAAERKDDEQTGSNTPS